MQTINRMSTLMHERKGAAGPAFLVWIFGGGLGLALVVFVLLKVIGA